MTEKALPGTKEYSGVYRYHKKLWFRLLCLFGVPVVWLAQMTLSNITASYGCYPHTVPLGEPLWRSMSGWLTGLNCLCFLTGSALGVLSYAFWQGSRRENDNGRNEHHAVEVGEGPTKFLAVIALMSNMLFVIAIAFTFCANVFVSACRAGL